MPRLHVHVQLDADVKRKIDEGLKIAYSLLDILHQINQTIKLRKGEVSPGVFVKMADGQEMEAWEERTPSAEVSTERSFWDKNGTWHVYRPGSFSGPDNVPAEASIYWDTQQQVMMQRDGDGWKPCERQPDDVPGSPRT